MIRFERANAVIIAYSTDHTQMRIPADRLNRATLSDDHRLIIRGHGIGRAIRRNEVSVHRVTRRIQPSCCGLLGRVRFRYAWFIVSSLMTLITEEP